MTIFLTFLPAWVHVVFYAYWVALVVMLIMDDREPSGAFFYVFFGRDWQVAGAFSDDMTKCREVTLADIVSVRGLKRFRNQAARRFSNVL